ncbi:MAG TPA: polysaccharide lyase family protein, partial [Bryobacteraceae bacterium]|nr:polysaccharide lyase family protein [Bryobacteraceae bacterium]
MASFVVLTHFSFANIPGGGTGNGANVTLTGTASNSTTCTMSNGIVSITMTKASAQITTINYTFNNTGTSQTLNLLSGNSQGGKLYWEESNNQGLSFTYSVVADPASNGGNYAEVALYSNTIADMPFEVHFSMLRGSTGFYVTAMWLHDSSKGASGLGECRDNIYAGSIFNWMSVDAARNKLMPVTGSPTAVGVSGAPAEVSLWTSGIYQGQYEDKYKFGGDFGVQRAWGWSSVGSSGKNVGLWNISASAEYYNGGPMKRELMCHMGTTILNMINGGHYGSLNQDTDVAAGEVWNKVCGPYFIYCNNVSSSITDMTQASSTLYADAVAQVAAEQTAWPYSWFVNQYYSAASNRGMVTGKIVINDIYNPNASAANLWVGVIQQPATSNGIYDFQLWIKPYQFWAKTDANGNFSIPNVIAGTNYTLYAFGPGAAGTFQSQPQNGGNTPNLEDLPASPFSVTVTGGTTTALGNVTWTPTRIGPTVFEIGYPDRTAAKFRHGDDYWVGDIGPSPTLPSPVWNKHLEYPNDFPSGPKYVVGTSRWSTDWNYVQPAVKSSTGAFGGSTSTITFNLPAALTGTASLYVALSSDYQGPLRIVVNNTDVAGSTGYFPNYSSSSYGSDVTIREGNHGIFSDARTTFNANLLHSGSNTISIIMRKGDTNFGDGWMNHAMYDYVRLEAPNYIPPAPASVTAFAGNNSVLLSWPAVPGATNYNVLRSTTSGSNYTALPVSITGPVCGSGLNNATYSDTTAINGTTYYYVIKAANPVGSSSSSSQSAGATPSASGATSVPSTPSGVVTTATNGAVTLSWNAVTGANYYTVYRSTLVSNGAGAYNTLSTIPLTNNVTGTTYTDSSPTPDTIHSYSVVAANAIGTSGTSAAVMIKPTETAPTTAPVVSTTPGTQRITLNWTGVPGADGYIIQSATTSGGPYTYLTSQTQLTYTDSSLADDTTYYYVVTAVNSGGSSISDEVSATTAPAAPTGLSSIAGNTQVTLKWTVSADATGYVIKRGTASGGSYSSIGTSAGPSFTDNGLTNGTTYYYVVDASNNNGVSVDSAEISTAPIGSVPVSPATLTAKAGNQKVSLNWAASSGAVSYSALRSTAAGGPYSAVATGVTTTSATNTGLTNGTAYYYVVAAANAGGTGAYSSEASATPYSPILKWSGTAGTAWDLASINWLSGATPVAYEDADTVTFDDSGATGTVVLSGTMTPAVVTFNNSTLSYTLSGAAISGSTSLVKSGTGTVTLSSTNTYSGPTIVNSGTLVVTKAGVLGSGTTTLQGGTLQASYAATFSNLWASSGTINALTNQSILTNLSGTGTLTLVSNNGGSNATS